MNNWTMTRRTAFAGLALLGFAAAAFAQSAPAPTYKVGDRWVYNVKSGIGLQMASYQETREVVSVGGSGAKVKITGKAPDGKDFTRIEEYSAPGAIKSGALCYDEVYRFPTPLARIAFPVAPNQRTSKWVESIAEPGGTKGQINYFVRTRNWDKQNTPAGSFDAIRVDVLMALDDATPFRGATNCNLTYWYSPAVRNTVRERRAAMYMGLDQQAENRVLDAFYELASFTPGK